MMGHREKMNQDEWEVFTKWRRIVCCLQRSGVVKKTKKRFNKRVRRASKIHTNQMLKRN